MLYILLRNMKIISSDWVAITQMNNDLKIHPCPPPPPPFFPHIHSSLLPITQKQTTMATAFVIMLVIINYHLYYILQTCMHTSTSKQLIWIMCNQLTLFR